MATLSDNFAFSRDIQSQFYRYIYGDDAWHKFSKSRVFIGGMGVLGTNVAENMVVLGIQELTIQDTVLHQNQMSEDDKKRRCNRAKAAVEALRKLSAHTVISFEEKLIDMDDSTYWSQFDCVVITEVPIYQLIALNKLCREQDPPVKFISGDVLGSWTYIFCDCGDTAIVLENYKEVNDIFLGKIYKGQRTLLQTFNERPHGLQSGDHVQIIDIPGNTKLNGLQFTVSVSSSTEFSVDFDTSHEPDELRIGGRVKYLGKENIYTFRSLSDETSKVFPANCEDFQKESCSLALENCIMENAETRTDNLNACIRDVLRMTVNPVRSSNVFFHGQRKGVSELMQYCNDSIFYPLSVLCGNLVSQEIAKCLTGKFTPLHHWFFLHCPNTSPLEYTFSGTSYVNQSPREETDKETLKTKTAFKVFVVGCKNICCRVVEYLGRAGLQSSGTKFTVSATDIIDLISVDIHRNDTLQDILADMLRLASSEDDAGFDFKFLSQQVSPETESSVYTDDFFQQQDLVISAVDSMITRRYINKRCVANHVPLIDIGVSGLKGHVQVIYPGLTESYTSKEDAVTQDIPYCTLKSFPEVIEHTIIWAREKFEMTFCRKPRVYNDFWNKYGSPKELLKIVSSSGLHLDGFIAAVRLLKEAPSTFQDCIQLARLKFEKYFNHKPRQILHSLPLCTKMPDGSLFWSPPKKSPVAIDFDANQQMHKLFIVSTSKLFAKMYGIQYEDKTCEIAEIASLLQSFSVPEFHAQRKQIETSPEASRTDNLDINKAQFYSTWLKENFLEHDGQVKQLITQTFDKNLLIEDHLDFIFAASSLRALVYGISPVDSFRTKMVAGNLVPLIQPTISVAASLATIEAIKIIGKADSEGFRNSFFNLALPLVVQSKPASPAVVAIRDNLTFTEWDRWDVHGHSDFTVGDFVNHFKEKYNLDLNLIVQGVRIIYMPFMPGHSKRLKERISRFLDPLPCSGYVDLTVSFENDDPTGNEESDLPVPPVRYFT